MVKRLMEDQVEIDFEEARVQPLLKGFGNREGSVSGPVCVVWSVDDLSKVKQGDVLVAESVGPDSPWFQAAKLACALVVHGDFWRYYSFSLSSSVGIPCIRGAVGLPKDCVAEERKNATEVLADGQLVTVDSMRGEVYDGGVLVVWMDKHGVGCNRILA